MKLVDFKLRWIIIPSLLVLTTVWVLPGIDRAAPATEMITIRSLEILPEGTEAEIVEDLEPINQRTINWQKWITWAISVGNGLLVAAVQIKKLKDK